MIYNNVSPSVILENRTGCVRSWVGFSSDLSEPGVLHSTEISCGRFLITFLDALNALVGL